MLRDAFVSCLGHTVTLRSVILCPKQLANTSSCLWTEFCGDKYDISAYDPLQEGSACCATKPIILTGVLVARDLAAPFMRANDLRRPAHTML